jgi:hypothetical protein
MSRVNLLNRGTKVGQYVMARYGDQGAYEVGNVKIILSTENSREGWALPGVRESRAKNMRKKHVLSEEGYKVLAERMVNSPPRLGKKGTKLKDSTKALMKAAQLRRRARERREANVHDR